METPKSQRMPYRRNLFLVGHGDSFESFLENMFSKKGDEEKEYVPLEKCLRNYLRYYFDKERKGGNINWEVYEGILSRFNEYCEPELFKHPPMSLKEKAIKMIEFINEVLPSGLREDGSRRVNISEWFTQTLSEIGEVTMKQAKKASAYTPPSRMTCYLKTTAKVPELADVFFPHLPSLEHLVEITVLPDPLAYWAQKGIGEYCLLYWGEALGWVLESFMEWQYQCEVERKKYWEAAKQELGPILFMWLESSVEESSKRNILLAYLNGRFHTPLDKWFSVVYKKWKDSKNV